ncbi:MAG: DUF1553 domain-containing protein [Pirellulales bacterium]
MLFRHSCSIVLFAVAAAPAESSAAGEVSFNRDVRPLLSNNCFQCHGPDEAHRKADLRFDTEEGVQAAFEGGLDFSEAWFRITTDDVDERMPPASAHKDLKPDEIGLLKRWIEQGAPWEGHWAFTTPRKAELPKVKHQDRVANPIDAFILQGVEAQGLSPSEPADRERLLRRVTFDLTGLPPTLEEIDAFIDDQSPKAYEKVVDRLLGSEHYGERMALAWLDAARYGDTSVFHADGPRDMWPWRDWVIEAYNSNKPFNEFTVEQLAGDLLPNATLDQKIATGFNRNNATTDEGGVIPEEFRVEYAVDRVKTTSMVWMGLTMECAQCHDHKFDPVSQEDYFRFYAYFNQAADPGMQSRGGNQAPLVNVMAGDARRKQRELEQQIAAAQQRLDARGEQTTEQFYAWADQRAKTLGEQPLLPEDALLHLPLDQESGENIDFQVAGETRQGKVHSSAKWAAGKVSGAFQVDGNNFIDLGDVGNFERDQPFSYGAWIKPEGPGSGAPIARMQDGNGYRGYDLYISGGRVAMHIIHSWPGNAVKVTTKSQVKPNEWQHLFVTYDGSSKAAGISIYFDGQKQEWDIEQDRLTETIRNDIPLYIGRRNPGSPFKGAVDDVRLYSRLLSEAEVAALAGQDGIGPVLAKPRSEWTTDELRTLQRFYLTSEDAEYQKLNQEIQQLRAEVAAVSKPVSTVMVMQDVAKPRPTFVLERGMYDAPNKEKPVEPGVPAALPPMPEDAPANRLGLAQWLTRDDHPLTARVAVNRYWYMLFGQGLVRSVEDFGAQGEWPSHPELLDWLAVDFVEHGWDVKRALKQMVMSNTYRQSSRLTPELRENDPENRLLARGPRFRLQGEFIRDNALAASGLLNNEIGGPGVKPYQPPGLWNEVSLNGNVRFQQDKGDKLYRRSMYIYWKRSAPMPTMAIFDAPTRETCVLRRSRTNTPLQALVTLNDPQFVEAARHLAQRVMTSDAADLDARIIAAYRLATGLQPSPLVLETLRGAYDEELAVFQQDQDRAAKLLAIGDSPREEKLDAAEHAAMTIVCSLIFNLDQTLTRG